MNGDKTQLVQLLIQGGAVSIAIITVFLFFRFASNHIVHNTEVLIRVEEASRAQVSATMDLTEVIRDLNATLK